MTQLEVETNAGEQDVVSAFRSAFFSTPRFVDHFKPTPLAHFRAQMSWRPTDVLDSAAAAKLAEVNFNRRWADYDHMHYEIGETIALTYEPSSAGDSATVRIWTDTPPTQYAIDVPNPIVLHTYCNEIFSLLKEGGFTVQPRSRMQDYKLPPEAPPGWPFGAGSR